MLVNKVGQHISLMGRSGNFHLILPTATVCSMVVGEHGPGHGSGRGTRSYLLRYKKSLLAGRLCGIHHEMKTVSPSNYNH
ncbi:hypothetical protein WDU94_012173 [Cyamophila willieti]